MLNNEDIKRAIRDMFSENPFLELTEEKFCSIYSDVLSEMTNRKINNSYGYARTIVYSLIKEEIVKHLMEEKIYEN